MLANKGYHVLGVDVLPEVVNTINKGQIHIQEPELDKFVHEAVNSGKLKCFLKPKSAEIFIIAVPTPFKNDHAPNLEYVESASRSIAPYIDPGALVILESTSPVGTTEKVMEVLEEEGVATKDVFIAHCPERVLPGNIMREIVENDRIVGGVDKKSTKKAAEFYKSFVKGRVLETTARTAEMVKLIENSYRDVNIAFANEVSMLCDRFNISSSEAIQLANRHPRVNILTPGVGVGGHCIAVDPWFIIHGNESLAKIMRMAREVNLYKTEWVLKKIKKAAAEFYKRKSRRPLIACLGITYKPDVDDMRESPALSIVRRLMAENFKVIVVEPNIASSKEFNLRSLDSALAQSDIVVKLVGHHEFRDISLDKKKKMLNFCNG